MKGLQGQLGRQATGESLLAGRKGGEVERPLSIKSFKSPFGRLETTRGLCKLICVLILANFNLENFTDMKMLLEIKDSKAAFVKELLNSLSFVKAKTITPEKALLIEEINEAVQELKLVKAGKKKARNAEEFLHEL